jgi:hypothetical protein
MGTMSVLFVFVLAGIVELGISDTLIIIAICVIVQSYCARNTDHSPSRFYSTVLFYLPPQQPIALTKWELLSRLPHAAPLKLALLASVFFVTNTLPVAAVQLGVTDRHSSSSAAAAVAGIFEVRLRIRGGRPRQMNPNLGEAGDGTGAPSGGGLFGGFADKPWLRIENANFSAKSRIAPNCSSKSMRAVLVLNLQRSIA